MGYTGAGVGDWLIQFSESKKLHRKLTIFAKWVSSWLEIPGLGKLFSEGSCPSEDLQWGMEQDCHEATDPDDWWDSSYLLF